MVSVVLCDRLYMLQNCRVLWFYMLSVMYSTLTSYGIKPGLLESGIIGIEKVAQVLGRKLCVLQFSSAQSNYEGCINNISMSNSLDAIDSTRCQTLTANHGCINSESRHHRQYIHTASTAYWTTRKRDRGSVDRNEEGVGVDSWLFNNVTVCRVILWVECWQLLK